MYYKNEQIFKICCKNRGYPDEILEKYNSEVNFTGRERSLKNKENVTQKKYCLLQHNIIWLNLTSRTKWWRNSTLFHTNFAQQKYLIIL